MKNELVDDLLVAVRELKSLAASAELKHKKWLREIHPQFNVSARNLIHYLAIRSRDLRPIQDQLSSLAISSLTHSEGYTMYNLERIESLLEALSGQGEFKAPGRDKGLRNSRQLLHQHTRKLFGPGTAEGHARLMVTLPSEAASDPNFVRDLVQEGMQVARVNTAHDRPQDWKKMIRHVRQAAKSTGKKVLIYMDLAGPKIRTGEWLWEGKDKPSPLRKGPVLEKGSRLWLIAGKKIPAKVQGPVMTLTLPAILRFVQKGDPVSLDDGKFSGRVLEASSKGILVEIHHAPMEKTVLKPEKGVNFPETDLRIPPLSKEDLAHLPFIAQHADMIGYSFVREVRDVRILQQQLADLGVPGKPIILKVENRRAFENLPKLMLTAMRQPVAGIMIARGDLAVEVGFMRIAEVQEEILWLAEAAHMPVIWATEILDNLVRKGRTTRAEVSDAVKSVRAECVMLNKGPFINDGLRMIRDIATRMSAHEIKKMKTLRSLHVAFQFLR